jgi:hypothetical protein
VSDRKLPPELEHATDHRWLVWFVGPDGREWLAGAYDDRAEAEARIATSNGHLILREHPAWASGRIQ